MNKAPLDKETLKKLRGRLLEQEKEQKILSSKAGRQELPFNRAPDRKAFTRAKEERRVEPGRDDEMSMGM